MSIFTLKHSGKLRRFLLYGCVAACHGMACVLYVYIHQVNVHYCYVLPGRNMSELKFYTLIVKIIYYITVHFVGVVLCNCAKNA